MGTKTFILGGVSFALAASLALAPTAQAVHDPDISALEYKCQTSASKANVKFVKAKAKCVDKCIQGARKVPPVEPEANCFPPYGGTAATCIQDTLKGAEAKAIAAVDKACKELGDGKTDCPECYASRSGSPDADCSDYGTALVVDGLINPGAPSLEAQIDAFGFVFCNDNPNTPEENKCESGLAKALVKFVGCKTKCYDKCNAAAHKGTIAAGTCNPPLPSDPTTLACLFDSLKGCEFKATSAADKACFTAPADAPECYGFTSSGIVSLVESAIDGNIPSTYCVD